MEGQQRVETDHLSATNNDALMKLFSYLDRPSQDKLLTVSARTNAIITDARFKKAKYGAGKLHLIREPNGHALTLDVTETREKFSLLHRLDTEAGQSRETKRRVTISRSTFRPENDSCATITLKRNYTKETVPDRFFDMVKELNADYSFDSIALQNMHFDNASLPQWLSMFQSIREEYAIKLFGCTFDAALATRDIEQLLLAMNRDGDLKVQGADPKIMEAVNEPFLRRWVNTYEYPALNIDFGTQPPDHRLIVSRPFLPDLARFGLLECAFMEMNVDLIVDFIMIKFDRDDEFFECRITTTGKIPSHHLARIDAEQFDVREDREVITRLSDGRKCVYSLEGARVPKTLYLQIRPDEGEDDDEMDEEEDGDDGDDSEGDSEGDEIDDEEEEGEEEEEEEENNVRDA